MVKFSKTTHLLTPYGSGALVERDEREWVVA